MILAVLTGVARRGRVADVARLGLPAEVLEPIRSCCHDNRMFWEPWVDSATSFAELSRNLAARGYTGIPHCGHPLVPYVPGVVAHASAVRGRSTMLRPLRSPSDGRTRGG